MNLLDNEYNNYDGNLGAEYCKDGTKFIVWAPNANNVRLALFGKDEKNYTNAPEEILDMNRGVQGTWNIEVKRDLEGEFYNYLIINSGNEREVVDPYAKALGVNGNRGMVIDLKKTDPINFEEDRKPELSSATAAVIYEVHVRDFSINENSGISSNKKGKYTAFCEHGTTIPGKYTKTGIDYLMELGMTHVHLLPAFDYETVDESKPDMPQYNWGYDPKNYFAPEGSYSTNPFNGEKRIREFKEMVKSIHEAGLRVVMDMVYNHTYKSHESNLNLAVPGYYYRQDQNGNFSNGSGCGNELASERYMVRKLIVDSVIYWAKEYHIDGFRFDLMGLHDIETMKQIRAELDKIDTSILMYGEGWTGGWTPLSGEESSVKQNIVKFDKMQIAAFSDDTRDSVKGHVFNINEKGYVNGRTGLEESIKFCIVGATGKQGINYDKVIYSRFAWANEPYQCINYISAHDNYTLWDKLYLTNNESSQEKRKNMNKLAAAIVLTSQGIPFFQAGEEFLRTKKNDDGSFSHDSYNAPDSVNNLEWDRVFEYKEIVNYYKGLIKLRKKYKAFRMNSSEEIRKNLTFLEYGEDFYKENVVAYKIEDNSEKNLCNTIVVIFNPNDEEAFIDLKECGWSVLVNKERAGVDEIYAIEGNSITVPSKCAHVLIKK
ncbi:type I pullulanase [Clostridium beijerinckii]|jgi:pullulanase, type I|uniref:Type I pullulanase n=1 Tax=Clostridium beijerinckii TaxID=1520 RepID=A0AAW3W751_CLOBE|nr:type I pullulanase [Clostridium beijerinckii]MBC2457481.1 type I pullulanase [Clostridium beijerinckii]MBC2474541.1 type I pullulanase [Clostridium beijerinckii]NOV61699.1 pullulanase [Clostridium beijerinckii]NOV68805.1 pullulanase [Clostridium beijerinckii]NOW35082.1 pullulanase [Clostridium beijerinckii]